MKCLGPVTRKEMNRSQKTQEAPVPPEMCALRRPMHQGGGCLGLRSYVITVLCLVAQPCLTLCDPVDCMWPTRFLYSWNSPGKNTGMGSHSLLQGIFLTQESNQAKSHCRPILYHLNQKQIAHSGHYNDR